MTGSPPTDLVVEHWTPRPWPALEELLDHLHLHLSLAGSSDSGEFDSMSDRTGSPTQTQLDAGARVHNRPHFFLLRKASIASRASSDPNSRALSAAMSRAFASRWASTGRANNAFVSCRP